MPKNNSIYQERINLIKKNVLPKNTKKKRKKQKQSKKVKRLRNNLNMINKQDRINNLKKNLIDVRQF